MKTQVPYDKPPIAGWKWPVILSLYDRSPLTPTEIEVLDRVRERPGRGKKRAAVGRSIQLSLQRLITPINDCLDYTQAHSFSRAAVISVLIREMQRRHSTFWEWASSEWLETLCVDGNAFRRSHKAPNSCRLDLMAVAYLLCEIKDFHGAGRFSQKRVARKVFGAQRVNEATQQLLAAVRSQGYGGSRATNSFPALIAELLLINRSPHFSDLTPELLEDMRSGKMANRLKNAILLISKALTGLGIFKQPLARSKKQPQVGARGAFQDVPDEWIEWCVRWKNTSTLSPASRWRIYYLVQKVGRWLTAHHPEIINPTQWTRETAVEFIAAVSRMNVGDYSYPQANIRDRIGKPMTPRAKASSIAGIRTFFTDLQEWEWIPRRFNPARAMAIPRSIRNLIAPDPRIIADDIWAKLLHAGLHITFQDLPIYAFQGNPPKPIASYPLEMVRAIAIVWLFSGLRCDEIVRLRVGCIRWQREEAPIATTHEVLPSNAVCYLHVPTNKTGAAFSKPVDPIVGDAIATLEKIRPAQLVVADVKTGEMVHYLFCYRGLRLGPSYLNKVLIPLLCPKPECQKATRAERSRVIAPVRHLPRNFTTPNSR